jgi:hypothetical protein
LVIREILLPFISILVFISGYGQKNIRCATDEVIRQQMAADPAFAKKVNEARKKQIPVQDRDQNKGKPVSITIPVVVHVVYNSQEQNISDEQVRSQMVVMNEDFTAANNDYNNYDAGYRSVKGDFNIQFCLVQVIHKQTTHKAFQLNDAMKFTKKGGSDAVDPSHYLNIWVCDIGDKYLAYAYIPGTISAERFGVVCHYKAFGKGSQYNLFSEYNLGRTITHEVGHCFGLEHIWGDAVCGDDFVDDTPLQNAPNFGCPGEGHLSTCTGSPLEMWMNYMDYTADRCMYFFSDGQAARADFFIETDPQLNSIINSACTNARTNNSDITSTSNNTFNSSRTIADNISLYPTITSGQLTISANNPTEGKVSVNIYNQAGALMIKQQIFISNGKRYDQIDVSKLPNGIYFVEFTQTTNKQTKKFIVHH